MGTVISKDTRRISFDNTISLNPILIQKTIHDNDVIGIEDISEKRSCKLNFNTNTKNTRMLDDEQDYWAQRIDHLKNEHQIINNIIEKEYEKTTEKTDKLFKPQYLSKEKIKKLQPCLDWRLRLLQCYEAHPRQPLLCSAVVEEFSKCVSSFQLKD